MKDLVTPSRRSVMRLKTNRYNKGSNQLSAKPL